MSTIKELDRYEVLTDSGFQSFDGIVNHGLKKTYRLTLESGKYLDCTKDQKIFYTNKDYKECQDYKINEYIQTRYGKKKIKTIEYLKTQMVYDLLNVHNGLRYYVDDILLHNCLYCDEFAFIDNDVEFYNSVYPTISSGTYTKMIITSTPRGMNLFYKLWKESEIGKNKFKHYHVHWSEHPKRDADWLATTKSQMSEVLFDQEYECEFLGSAGTLISGHKLKQLAHSEQIHDIDKYTKIYADPVQNRVYVGVADVSEGVSKDSSVLTIIDATEMPYKQVLVYRNNEISPSLFAEVIVSICKKYNGALAIIESNSYGGITLDTLWNDLEYENILKTKVSDGENVAGGRKSTLGIRTTKKTKPLGCSYLKDLIEQNQLIINDFETINELSTFIKVRNTYQAERGKHDDIVMTLVIFAWFANQSYFEDEIGINTGNQIRQKLNEENNFNAFFGFFDDGISEDLASSMDYF